MKLLPGSLFGRMFALSLLTTLVALVFAGVAIGGVLQRFVTQSVDARLRDRLAALESAVHRDGTIDPAAITRVTARFPRDEPWQIETPAGVRLGAGNLSEEAPALARPAAPPRGHSGPTPAPLDDVQPFDARMPAGERVHGLASTLMTLTGSTRVSVAVPREQIDRPVLAALAPLAASLAILGFALGGAALIQLRLGLRPLRALRHAVEAIRRGRAGQVPEDVPDELRPLARELNALADENAAALAGARAAAANLAHALKTPVSTLALHLADDRAAQAQLGRIDATLRHHLGRARATAIDRRAVTPLAPALNDLAAAITALHMGRVAIAVDVAPDLVAGIDAQDLDELAGNLIDNAARHAAATVRISANAQDRHVWLTVTDDGEGIDAQDRERATTPGTRLDERGSGHGFGLSIVRELAELYGGALTLGDAPGGGLMATVSLPPG
ncbi:ATP-binding protein [Sphingomonas hominis]